MREFFRARRSSNVSDDEGIGISKSSVPVSVATLEVESMLSFPANGSNEEASIR